VLQTPAKAKADSDDEETADAEEETVDLTSFFYAQVLIRSALAGAVVMSVPVPSPATTLSICLAALRVDS